MSRPASDIAYWDTIAAVSDALPGGWRRQARREHLGLVHDWIGAPVGRWLKTDLYEERDADRALLGSLATGEWVGVDISPAVVGASGASGAAADIRRLPFADGSFEGVLSTSTLDHFDAPVEIERSLVEIRRVLRPGGHLLLTLDNPRNPLVRVRNALPRAVARRTGLVPFAVGVTLAEAPARRLLASVGFDVLASTHLLHAPHVLGTRLAVLGWYERRVLPRFASLADRRSAPWTGHFVAFHAVVPSHP
jgi:SAM-dependent methyltransferase